MAAEEGMYGEKEEEEEERGREKKGRVEEEVKRLEQRMSSAERGHNRKENEEEEEEEEEEEDTTASSASHHMNEGGAERVPTPESSIQEEEEKKLQSNPSPPPSSSSLPPLPSNAAISAYATQLGLRPGQDAHLLWLAERALLSPLPPSSLLLFDHLDEPFFYDTTTKQASWDHPHEGDYVYLVTAMRTALEEAEEGGNPPTLQEVMDMATYLGIEEGEEMERWAWIAYQAFLAPLPRGWKEEEEEEESGAGGRLRFVEEASGYTTQEHPLDRMFRSLLERERRVWKGEEGGGGEEKGYSLLTALNSGPLCLLEEEGEEGEGGGGGKRRTYLFDFEKKKRIPGSEKIISLLPPLSPVAQQEGSEKQEDEEEEEEEEERRTLRVKTTDREQGNPSSSSSSSLTPTGIRLPLSRHTTPGAGKAKRERALRQQKRMKNNAFLYSTLLHAVLFPVYLLMLLYSFMGRLTRMTSRGREEGVGGGERKEEGNTSSETKTRA